MRLVETAPLASFEIYAHTLPLADLAFRRFGNHHISPY